MNRIPPQSMDEFRAIFPGAERLESGLGFVPTSMRVMAHRPPILEGFATFAGAILGPGEVDRALKQLIALMVSRTTGCLYCQAHTGHAAHGAGVDEAKLQALWDFETDGRFSGAERAALRFARDSAVIPVAVGDDHFVALREHFTDPQIVEIVSVASLFGFLNRFNDTLANELEPAPLDFAAANLTPTGWSAGKHAAG